MGYAAKAPGYQGFTPIVQPLNEFRAKATSVRQRYEAEKERITNDRTLSDHGKNEALDKLTAETHAALREIREAEAKLEQKAERERVDQIEGLRMKLLVRSEEEGADPSLSISYRDAATRAVKLGNDKEAAQMIRQAVLDRDIPLQRLILRRAFNERWDETVQAYGVTDKVNGPVATELWDMVYPSNHQSEHDALWAMKNRIDADMSYNLPGQQPIVDRIIQPTESHGTDPAASAE